MKHSILMFLFIGVTFIFFGCSEKNPSAPELSQSDQVTNTLAKEPLQCTIVYLFVGHLEIFDAEGRLLVWDGEIHGDIEGQILWWFVLGAGPPIPEEGHVKFYEARWEIWDGDDLLLAGNSAGKTAMPPGKDGIWRGNGIVTEVSAGFEDWEGRHTHEGGNVNFVSPISGSGEGIFRIN
jgi:hypothetical protein